MNAKRTFRSSLIIFVLFVVAIPTISLSVFFVKWIYEDTSKAALTELEYQVNTVTEHTARDIEQITFRLKTLSSNADVLEGTVKSPIGLRNSASFQAKEYVKQITQKHELLAATYLIDADLELYQTENVYRHNKGSNFFI